MLGSKESPSNSSDQTSVFASGALSVGWGVVGAGVAPSQTNFIPRASGGICSVHLPATPPTQAIDLQPSRLSPTYCVSPSGHVHVPPQPPTTCERIGRDRGDCVSVMPHSGVAATYRVATPCRGGVVTHAAASL